jgi:hypothetical protein
MDIYNALKLNNYIVAGQACFNQRWHKSIIFISIVVQNKHSVSYEPYLAEQIMWLSHLWKATEAFSLQLSKLLTAPVVKKNNVNTKNTI